MQDYKTLLGNLKKILAMRISSEQEITEKLTAIIGKDYKSVWRRLRGEYKFSFDEIFNICNELGISIESLAQRDPASISTLHLYQYPTPQSFDFEEPHIKKIYATMETAARAEDSAFTCVCNRIPEILYIGYPKLSQLLHTKLNYFVDPDLDPGFNTSLHKHWNEYVALNERYVDIMQSFRDLTILWGPHIMDNVVSDVLFFRDIEMITDEDVRQIKKELTEMTGKIDSMCRNPSGTEYENFVFAVSPIDMNFHSNMITSSKGNQVIYFLYHLAFTYSENEAEIKLQKTITDCLMKGAAIISGSNHGERTRFIKKQLEALERL